MAEVALRGVRKSFGPVDVIKGIDLDIAHGEFCVFVGPSGCGKSTLLRLIAGLEDITAGTLGIGGLDMTRVPPANRGIAMVFQSYALYPHMTVGENISFGLRMTNTPKPVIAARVAEAARLLQFDAYLDRKPSQLSGGQRQRVAIGRAIVREPKVFLFDEPLSNLDAALRSQTRVELLNLHRTLGATMIYVTHDQVEAMTMADKIVVLQGGEIEQVGTPLELYERPCNLFVAGFIGSPRMNTIPARVAAVVDSAARLELPGGAVSHVRLDGIRLAPGPVLLGIRPEHVAVDGAGPPGEGLAGTVTLAEHLGAETILHVEVAQGPVLVARADGRAPQRIGQPVTLTLDPRFCHLFDPAGPALLNAPG